MGSGLSCRPCEPNRTLLRSPNQRWPGPLHRGNQVVRQRPAGSSEMHLESGMDDGAPSQVGAELDDFLGLEGVTYSLALGQA